MNKSGESKGPSPSQLISRRIAELGDWRGQTLSRMRELIQEADPEVVEEWKWAKTTNPGTPVWSHGGILCTGESYKNVVKLTFMKGASLEDPAGLFNSSLEGNARRAIDIQENEEVDAAAFQALVRQAIALNGAGSAQASKTAKSNASKKVPAPAARKATARAAKKVSRKKAPQKKPSEKKTAKKNAAKKK